MNSVQHGRFLVMDINCFLDCYDFIYIRNGGECWWQLNYTEENAPKNRKYFVDLDALQINNIEYTKYMQSDQPCVSTCTWLGKRRVSPGVALPCWFSSFLSLQNRRIVPLAHSIAGGRARWGCWWFRLLCSRTRIRRKWIELRCPTQVPAAARGVRRCSEWTGSSP